MTVNKFGDAMSDIKRVFFLADDAEAKALNEEIFQEHEKHRQRINAFFAAYGATIGMQRRGFPTRVLISEDSEIPDGMKKDGRHFYEGKTYVNCVPVGNTKIGRAIKAEMKAVGGFDASEMILKHYGAGAMILSGGRSHHAVGYTRSPGAPITIDAPENDEYPYATPSSFRKIKRSEYIAITEE